MCPPLEAAASMCELREEVDELLLLLEERKLWSSTSSSSINDDEDEDGDELSSDSELRSSS